MTGETASRVFKEKGDTCVWIRMTDEGELRLNGQNLGGAMGTSEYEYIITVQPEDFPIIRAALDGPPDRDVVDLMCDHADEIFSKGESTWLKDLGIDIGFSNWFSFD